MKAEKINELYEWVEWEDINPDSINDCLDMYKRMSEDLFEWELEFDIVDDHYNWAYLICSVYKNIEWKEWYSCIVSRDVVRGFDTPQNFVKYVAELYDRAMEILDN